MARSNENSGDGEKTRRSSSGDGAPAVGGPGPELTAPGTTGRYLVLLRTDAIEAGVRTLSDVAGLTVANTADVEGGALDATMLTSGNAIVFDKLAVAVVDTPPEQIHMLGAASAEESGILAIEPERVVYALAEAWPTTVAAPTTNGPSAPPVTLPSPVAASNGSLPVEYLSGYRDAVDHLVDRVLATAGVAARATPEAVAAVDESVLTWGLQVTKVAESRFTGKGVRVAVLDTGFDVGHPDFAGRRIVTQSFVPGQDVQDGHGHGTHCIGTSMGPKQPGQLPRYGIAYEADIYAGKVLSNQGSGTDSGILAGINWAITNRCAVVSMSLGAAVLPGQGFSRVFEAVARRALAAGTLIVAAAGNESHRPDFIKPVGHPANCPSIMAIAAIDSQLQVTYFSSAGINPQGGQVDIAAPGLQVRSSWPRPTLYRTISGTSMATPHVAGIAALHAEANPDVRGGALGWLLLQSARRLDLSTQDIGAGLVQAP